MKKARKTRRVFLEGQATIIDNADIRAKSDVVTEGR